jgi:hypothetical protein
VDLRYIHNPTITAYLPPKDKATGAAVIICPGGGHRELVFNGEGAEPARYLNSIAETGQGTAQALLCNYSTGPRGSRSR